MATAWVVDDDREMCEAMGLMLRLLGYAPRAFFDARSAAKALLAGERPDLVLLDLNMPEVGGDDLLEFIRSRQRWQNIPVVMLTSEFAETEQARLLQLGANGYLTKPVTLEELQDVLSQLFR
ncbi:MAG TPA: response regulator [Anaerolineae bacterium]|nr:response regulator [Anaerolineae bacterium]HID85670.1 response regulator [Anaerolineales bacterium]HIQ09491.1 response regulator [Anaerolineaceae bacterium]